MKGVIKPKNVIVAGGRDFVPTTEHHLWLKDKLKYHNAQLVVTGGARGADQFGFDTAKEIGIKTCVIVAKWHRFGPSAGAIRNEEMADLATLLFAFPGGPGTKNMCDIMRKQKKRIIFYEDIMTPLIV